MEMGKAISQKIREAIRAKLIDLGNYVDEELPDYIMVMIANKKTEAQMKEDLALFMGPNTDKFCGWLQSVLTKLQAARNEQKERKEKAKEKKKKSKKKDEKKEKKRHSSSGDKDKKKDEEEESLTNKKSHDTSAKPAAESGMKEEPALPKTTEEPSTSSAVSIEPVNVQETPEAKEKQPQQDSVLPSQSVISLLPDTNDFLDEEIKMSEPVRKVATESKQSKAAKSKDLTSMASSARTSSQREQKEHVFAVTRTDSRKSPPIVVTMRARGGRIGQDLAGRRGNELAGRSRVVEEPARLSVKARLGIPATKRRADVVERRREVMPSRATMSKVVRVPAVPIKRSGPGSVIGQVIQGEEEESDDEPTAKRVASTVKPRRRQPLPKTKQNSMALLKRAMTQATESTSVFPAAGQFAEPVRMIVRSASQSGSMKIVARSIPAEKEPPRQAKLPQRKLLASVVQAAKQSIDVSKPSRSKASVSVKPMGLMSRSRFNEAKERNFDAYDYQRVDDQDEEKDEQRVAEDEGREEEKVEGEEQEEEEEEEEEKAMTKEENTEDEELEGERQIINLAADSPEKVQLQAEELMEGGDDELEGKRVVEEEEEELEEQEDEEEEREEEGEEEIVMEVQEHVFDTRTTKIVRPLHFERLAALQKRVQAPSSPQPPEPPLKTDDVNPYFIVTMEGKKGGGRAPKPFQPQRNPVLSSRLDPRYQPSRISSMDTRLQLSRYEQQPDLMEVEVLEEKYLEYEPMQAMQYHQIVMKEKLPMSVFAKESPIGRVMPAESEGSKDAVFSLPHPKVEPISFSLHESDEEHAEAPMEEEEKVNERCKFWPACKNAGDCPFVHPSTPCKTFPNCKFGDKCLFIHPNCKFDASCMNPSCPFTHATRTTPTPVIIQAPPIRPSFRPAQSKAVCKFYPNCTNTRCPFVHPKMCRYDRSCTRPDCKFTHSKAAPRTAPRTAPRAAPRAAMKWTKEQHISERKFASKSPTST